ncbi:MAG: decaprenyl-phosphate phosphoribosyltransferase [Actinomycetes bacterium]
MAEAQELPSTAAPAARRSHLPPLLRACRPKQWLKNVLVFAAPAAAGVLGHTRDLFEALVAFVAFCLAASGTYLLNDAADVESDRRHPTKRFRPIAAGELAISTARIVGTLMLVAGVAVGFLTGWRLPIVVVTYVVLTTSYSLWGKRVPVLDLGMVAAGFVLRTVAGAVAVDVPISVWFYIVASFGSLFVVAGKRHSEMVELGAGREQIRSTLGVYSESFLGYVRSVATGVTMVAYCLWAFEKSAGTAGFPWYEASIVPFVLAFLRYAFIVDRGEAGAPEEVVLHDRTLQAFGLVWAITAGIGILVHG